MNPEIPLPRFRERFFPRMRSSVPDARRFMRDALTAWAVGDRTHEVLLCVSELATNALLHGVPPGRGFRILVWLDHDGLLRIEVHDSGDGRPHLTHAGDDEESGRGLVLVEACADKWGVGGRDPGKVVWCEFVLVEYAPFALPHT
ncbi:ATP-binding protein [Streptomyces sp. NPDC054796]